MSYIVILYLDWTVQHWNQWTLGQLIQEKSRRYRHSLNLMWLEKTWDPLDLLKIQTRQQEE